MSSPSFNQSMRDTERPRRKDFGDGSVVGTTWSEVVSPVPAPGRRCDAVGQGSRSGQLLANGATVLGSWPGGYWRGSLLIFNGIRPNSAGAVGIHDEHKTFMEPHRSCSGLARILDVFNLRRKGVVMLGVSSQGRPSCGCSCPAAEPPDVIWCSQLVARLKWQEQPRTTHLASRGI